jgi:hypothetical protein
MPIQTRLLAAALAAGLTLAAGAQAAMTEDQVKVAIERDFGVRVLRIVSGTADGRGVFLVTVMNPGGEFNEAFQVTRLVVDAETGKLVPQFRHGASGHSFSNADTRVPNRQLPDAVRDRTWR